MEKTLNEKYSEALELLKNADGKKIAERLPYFARWIAYFQHERLIHLIVTVTFAILLMLCTMTFLAIPSVAMLALLFVFFIMTAAYVRHYYILENTVQAFYKAYDEMEKKAGKSAI